MGRWIVIIVVALVALSGIGFPLAGSSAPPDQPGAPPEPVSGVVVINGDWNVSGWQRFLNATIHLNGNLTILESGILELTNTTLAINLARDGMFRVGASGTFAMADLDEDPGTVSDASRIVSNRSGARYMFTANPSAHIDFRNSAVEDCGYDGLNPGLNVLTGDAVFDGMTFSGCYNGLTLRHSGADLLNSIFANNRVGIYSYQCNPLIRNVTVSGSSYRGMHLYYSAPVLEDCSFQNNPVGIFFQNSEPVARRCSVSGPQSTGVMAWYSSPLLEDCSLANAMDIQASLSSFPRLVNTTLNESRVSLARGLHVSVGRHMSALVVNGTGDPQPSVRVAVLDSEGNPASGAYTDGSGLARDLVFRERLLTPEGPMQMGWHSVMALGQDGGGITWGLAKGPLSEGDECQVTVHPDPDGVAVWPSGHSIWDAQEYSGMTIICQGDLTIQAGASLSLINCSLSMLSSGVRTVSSLGSLLLVNTSIAGISVRRALTPEHVSVRFAAGSFLDVEGSEMRWVNEVEVKTGYADIRNLTIAHAAGTGLKVDSCSPALSGLSVEWAPKGLWLANDQSSISGVTVNRASEYCVYASQSRASIAGLDTRNSSRGLYSYMGSMSLSGVGMEDCDLGIFGMYAKLAAAGVAISGASETGILAIESKLTLLGGTISDSRVGIQAQASSLWAEGYAVSGGNIGLQATECTPVILNSSISGMTDVSVGRGASASLVNCTPSAPAAAIEPTGFVDIGHWTDVLVLDGDSQPVAGCNVSILDSDGRVSGSGTTRDDGIARSLAFREARMLWNRTETIEEHILLAFASPLWGRETATLEPGGAANATVLQDWTGWMDWPDLRSVAADETHSNITIVSHAGAFVDFGACLSLENVTLVLYGAPMSNLVLEAQEGGLDLMGCRVVQASARAPLQPARAWIVYRPFSSGRIEGTNITGLVEIDCYTDDLAVESSLFSGMAGVGIYAQSCSPSVNGTSFAACGDGIWSVGGSPAVTECSFFECAGNGFFAGGGEPAVEGSVAVECAAGFHLTEGAAGSLSGCRASANDNGFLLDGASPSVADCEAVGNSNSGFSCMASQASLNGVIADGNYLGLYCYQAWPTVSGSRFTGNGQGVQSVQSGPYISGCTIDGNQIGFSESGMAAGIICDEFSSGKKEESATFIGQGLRDHIGVTLPSRAIVTSAELAVRGGDIGRDAVLEDKNTQFYPELSGDWLVWQDYRDGNWDIYAYDLGLDSDMNGIPNYLETPGLEDDPALVRITDEEAFQGEPDIHGDTIVWTDYRNSDGDVYAYTLSNSTEWAVCTESGYQSRPAMGDGRIVWQDSRDGNNEIYMLNITTGDVSRLSYDPNHDMSPAIDGDYVVWYSYHGSPPSNDYSDVMLFDIKHWTLENLNKDLPIQYNPDVQGDTVVWHDNRDGNWEIYQHNITTGATSRLTYDPQKEQNFMPRVDGTTVVYYFHHRTQGIWSVRMSDKDTGEMTTLEHDADGDSHPVVDGTRIAWVNRTGNLNDIHVLDMSLAGRPSDVTLDIYADSSPEFTHAGEFDGTALLGGAWLAEVLNSGLGKVSGGTSAIPMQISSQGIGRVSLGPLEVQYTVPTYVVGTVISNSSQAGALCSGSAAAFVNSSFSSNANDMQLAGSARPKALNSTFNGSRLSFLDAWSNLTVQNYLHVRAENMTGSPLDAEVEIADNGDVAIAGRTGLGGDLDWSIVTDRMHNATGAWENVTSVSVALGESAFADNPRIVDMSSSHWEVFSTDTVRPAATGMFPPPGWAFAGLRPEISVIITDNLAIDISSLELYVEGFKVFISVAPVTGGYNVSYMHPQDFSNGSTVDCRVRARDFHGNSLDMRWTFHIDIAARTWVVELHAGWNLVSVPLVLANNSVCCVLATIEGKYDSVIWYDPEDRADPWKTYRPGSAFNDLRAIDRNRGFWIRATEDCSLAVSGLAPGTTQITLHAGWNLVGYPSETESNVAVALWGTGADRVEVHDPGSPTLIMPVPSSYTMKPGQGYWVRVAADTVWVVDW